MTSNKDLIGALHVVYFFVCFYVMQFKAVSC